MSVKLNLDELAHDGLAQQQAKQAAVTTVTLNEVKALAERQSVLAQELEALESQVVAKKEELRQVAEEKLPTMLIEIGLPSLTLADGSVITVRDNIYASIDDSNRVAAHKWVRDHGFGDLIKNTVSVVFGKGEDDDAKLLMSNIEVLASNGTIKFGTLDQKEQIHNSTLRAFVKERLKSGSPFPGETFKLFEGKVAELRKPKLAK